MKNDDLNEQMLNAWLRLSTDVSNDRLVKNMPFNEALICNILNQESSGNITATDLCEKTKMLKSQMNRTLKSMEEKGLIVRERSMRDQRQVYISLSPEHRSLFEEEHEKNLQIVGVILDRYGRDKARALIDELTAITDIIEEVLI